MNTVLLKKAGLVSVCILLLMGCRKNKEFSSEVVDGPAPEASFSYKVDVNDAKKVSFTNSSTNAESYYWQFGDGTTSTESAPVHSYAAAGRYNVKLVTRSAAGYSSEISSLVVAASKSEALFNTGLSSGVYVTFNNMSVSLDSCVWDFGDGSAESKDIAPVHVFPSAGTYPVKLTVYGIAGDESVLTKNITVNYECINGGGFETGDAQYWTLWSQQTANPPTFGYAADKPSAGSGGCLQFPLATASSGQGKNGLIYQPVYVRAGKKYQFSAQVKLPAGGKQCYMQFYLSDNANTWSENNGNPPTQLFVSLNAWHGWGGTSGAGPTVAVDGSIITISHSFGSYGPYAGDGIYTANSTGWMYVGIQAGTWEGTTGGSFLIDDVSFKQLP